MKRREEIERVANEFYEGDEVSTFVVAAQWADKTLIDKARQWFEDRFYNGGMHLRENPYGGYKGYYYGIWELDNLNDERGQSKYFDSYEEALSEGIKEAIKHIEII